MPEPSEDAPSEYAIFETDEFQRRLDKLPRTDMAAIRAKLDGYVYPQLREQPFFGNNRSSGRTSASCEDTARKSGATESAASACSMPSITKSGPSSF